MPGGHGTQLDVPALKTEYEPAEQKTHVAGVFAPTADEEEPGLHCVQLVAPAEEEYEFCGHCVHVAWPERLLYQPARQEAQVEASPAPSVALAVPGAQAVQVAAEVAPTAVE